MVQIAATKRTTLHRVPEGRTLETALTECRLESGDGITVTDLLIEQRSAVRPPAAHP